jgi:hypothetical protein
MTDYSWWKDIRTGKDPRRNKIRGAFAGLISLFLSPKSQNQR